MAQAKAKQSLGRGLSGLISGNTVKVAVPASTNKQTATGSDEYQEIALSSIANNPYQPRTEFNEAHIQELANSIQQEGLIQPIVVRAEGKGFILIAGERRLRAFRHLKRKKIPARIMSVSDRHCAIVSLVENLQREHLNPMDEAMGYASLMRDFDLTQEAVAKQVGKARASITNALRLLTLPESVQGQVATGSLSVGHAKVLLGLKRAKAQAELANEVIAKGLSVRQTQARVDQLRSQQPAPSEKRPELMLLLGGVAEKLERKLGANVTLKPGLRKGKIVIDFKNNDHLHAILQAMGL